MSVLAHFLQWKLGLAKATTQTTDAERDCLARHATGKRLLAEIGVWHGVTTCRMRAVMAADGLLFAVDPYPLGRFGFSYQRIIAHHELRRIKNGTVEWVRQTGAAAAATLAPRIAGKLEMLFIDGDHSYEGLQADWEGWSGLLAPHAIVALHDSRSTLDRPIPDAGSVRYTDAIVS